MAKPIPSAGRWPLAGYPAVRRMLRVVGNWPFGAVDSLANVVARITASRYGVGRRMSRADRCAFLGPWRSRVSRQRSRRPTAHPQSVKESVR